MTDDQKKQYANLMTLNDFDKKEIKKMPHRQLIKTYLERVKSDEEYKKKFSAIFKRDALPREILIKYFIYNWSVQSIAETYSLSNTVVSSFIVDYLMTHYDDSKVEQVALLDSESHLGVLDAFFASVLYVSRDAAMNAIFARKIREEIAKSIQEHGVLPTAANKELMKAWKEASEKTVKYAETQTKQLQTYMNLMEKVLDMQRAVAFVKIMYDKLRQYLPEEAVEELNAALQEDEYAKAVLNSLPGNRLVKVFKQRQSEEGFLQELQDGEDILLDYIDAELASSESDDE